MYIEARMLNPGKIEIMKVEDSYPGFFVYEDDSQEIFISLSSCNFSRNKTEPRKITIATPSVTVTAFLASDQQIAIFDKIIKIATQKTQTSR